MGAVPRVLGQALSHISLTSTSSESKLGLAFYFQDEQLSGQRNYCVLELSLNLPTPGVRDNAIYAAAALRLASCVVLYHGCTIAGSQGQQRVSKARLAGLGLAILYEAIPPPIAATTASTPPARTSSGDRSQPDSRGSFQAILPILVNLDVRRGFPTGAGPRSLSVITVVTLQAPRDPPARYDSDESTSDYWARRCSRVASTLPGKDDDDPLRCS
ncbi:hypothetical protein C8Q73DRAFT_278854 [Cubamyces lactineus]|nr:hypothetical protein C8Q73DRAFT_278854 [Cubamyces lactineus]